MELLSACYYQQGRNGISLLLQKFRYRQVQILFTCICAGNGSSADREGSYMAEKILHWFRNLDFKYIMRKPEKGLMRLEESLYKAVYRTDGELEYSGMAGENRKVDVAGIFCIENRYVMFRRGAGHVCLVNTAFGRVHIRHMCRMEDRISIEQGVMQPDIVMLFSMDVFCRYVTDKMIEDGLAVGEVVTEEQMSRHIRELGKEGERFGGTNMGAVLLRTC